MNHPIFQLVFASIPLFLTLYTGQYREADLAAELEKVTESSPLPKIEEYDFIVVGAGSAGGIVAAGLAEHFSVLVLEAGGPPPPQSELPSANGAMHNNPELVYQWLSVPQENASQSNGGRVFLRQGKALGGGSSVNTMNYNRGNGLDYDAWAEATGDNSWSYQNILKYFKQVENFGQEAIDNDHLGSNGKIGVVSSEMRQTPIELEWSRVWREAGVELGYEINMNANGPQKEGFGPTSINTNRGRRASSYHAYLKPLIDSNSPNLHISSYSVVEKITFDGDVATGVFYTKHGINRYAKAKKEIILSAGSMNSPVILLKSGVGPRADLEEIGIPVVKDLPVGQNTQDHVFLGIEGIQVEQDAHENITQAEIDEYLKEGTGPLANNFEFAQSYMALNEAEPAWPNIQMYVYYHTRLVGLGNTLGIYVNFNRPKSRGVIKLDANKTMVWDPNALMVEEDFNYLLEGTKLAYRILDTSKMTEAGITYPKVPIPDCAQHEFLSDEYFDCFVRYESTSAWHPASSCKMGRADDPTAVTDTKLKVIGFTNLRVIDNSIMVSVTNGNTNAPAMMIGSKGLDLVLQDHLV